MKKVWVIRFIAAGAGLATASLCFHAIRAGRPPAATPVLSGVPGAAAPGPLVVSEPGADILCVNPAFAETAPARRGPVWCELPAAAESPGLRVEVVTPHLEARRRPEGTVLHLAGQAGPMPGGAPDLPVLARVDPGYAGKRARVEVTASSYVDIPDVSVAPAEAMRMVFTVGEEPETRTSREPDPAIYGRDAFWPPELAAVEEVWMGTQKLVRTALHPVQYNPVTETVRYYENLSVAVVFEEEPVPKAAASGPAVETVDPFGCPPLYGDPVLPPVHGHAADFALRRSGVEAEARFKILVAESGVYKVTQPELLAAGVAAPDLVGAGLRLFCRDREVAIETSTPGLMGAGDFFVFYGEGYNGLHTGTNVYWLGFGGSGLRMASVSGAPVGGVPTSTVHYAVATYAPNARFEDKFSPLNENWDHWYAKELLTAYGTIYSLVDQSLFLNEPVPGMDFKICVSLHGIAQTAGADPGHNTYVQVSNNGNAKVLFQWSGTGEFGGAPLQDAQLLSSSYLQHGWNKLYAWQKIVGNQGDQVYVEAISLVYPRSLLALADELAFAGEAGHRNYRVDRFTSDADLWILDTSDPVQPVRVTQFATAPTANGFRLLFARNRPETPAFLALREADFKTVPAIREVAIRGLADTRQQADYIVICPYDFRQQTYRLITNRYLKGHSVVVAPIDDIYHEFSYGVEDVAAVRQFLGYAFHHWQSPPPRYVLLVGDGTYDPRAYLGSSAHNILPVYFGGTPYNFAAMDTWFTLVNGDDIAADMIVGRIPVSTSSGLAAVVDKIVAYEATSPAASFRKRGLIAQDQGANFDVPADQVYAIMNTNGFTSINRQIAGAGGSKSGVISAINDGVSRYLAAYFGHGSHFAWDEPALLESSDMASLANVNYPLVTATTCINGYFVNLNGGVEGLAEALVERAGAGAVAGLAGTALSQEFAANEIALSFCHAAIGLEMERLGEAMAYANQQTFALFSTAPELLLYQIFGDPGLIINP